MRFYAVFTPFLSVFDPFFFIFSPTCPFSFFFPSQPSPPPTIVFCKIYIPELLKKCQPAGYRISGQFSIRCNPIFNPSKTNYFSVRDRLATRMKRQRLKAKKEEEKNDQEINVYNKVLTWYLKWWGSFFLNHNKSLDGISGITKNIFFFHLKACERRNFDFCVFLRMCSMPVKNRFI